MFGYIHVIHEVVSIAYASCLTAHFPHHSSSTRFFRFFLYRFHVFFRFNTSFENFHVLHPFRLPWLFSLLLSVFFFEFTSSSGFFSLFLRKLVFNHFFGKWMQNSLLWGQLSSFSSRYCSGLGKWRLERKSTIKKPHATFIFRTAITLTASFIQSVHYCSLSFPFTVSKN